MIDHQLVIERALHCAGLFRLGRDIEGALKMVELIDLAMPHFANGSTSGEQPFAQILSALLQCQERQDWIGVADWLEYEWVGLIDSQRAEQ